MAKVLWYLLCLHPNASLNSLARRHSLNVNQIQQQKSLLERQAGHVLTILLLPFWKECFPWLPKITTTTRRAPHRGDPKAAKTKHKIKQRDSRQTSIYTGTPPKKKKSGAANDPSDTCGQSYSEYLTCLPCAAWFAQMTIYWENSACLGLVRSNEMSS